MENVNKVVYNNETIIDISDSEVTEDTLAKGVVGYNSAGARVTGQRTAYGAIQVNNTIIEADSIADTLTFKAGANIELSANANEDSVTIATTLPTDLMTEAEVDAKLAAFVDSAPEALNTLKELAAALGNDPNFATTVAEQIGAKLSKTGGAVTGTIDFAESRNPIDFGTVGWIRGKTASGGQFDIFGYSNPLTLQVGGTYPALALKGKNARPTYNDNEVALKEDIPEQLSLLENDVGYVVDTSLGSAAYTASTDYIPVSQRGAKNGVATLDNNGIIPTSQLPSNIGDVQAAKVAAEAARDAAKTAAGNAETSASSAAAYASQADASQSTASKKASEANGYASTASSQASIATEKATSATNQASAAEASASRAGDAAARAEQAALNLDSAVSTAEGARDNAVESADEALAAKAAAEQAKTSAEESAISAATNADLANSKATEASQSATNAIDSASEASTAAAKAATSEDNAQLAANSASESAARAEQAALDLDSAVSVAQAAKVAAEDAAGKAADTLNALQALLAELPYWNGGSY